MKLRFLSLSLITILLLTGNTLPLKKAWAASSSDILVNMVPENPAPGENVNITLSSYAYNLDSVSISWSVNGKSGLSGIGQKSFSVNAPSAGSETNVIAKIALPDGSVETKIIIRPSVMVLLWQADDSYVPPFYKGKALPSLGSAVRIVAMPEIKSGSKLIDPQNMLYVWQQDYNNQPDSSGYGKNSFIYTSDYLENSSTISVTASTLDQKYSSTANINVGMTQPKILFYKNDTNLGTLWEKALLDGYKISGSEVIQAAPYFISPKDIRIPTLSWNWSINDNFVSVPIYAQNLLSLQVQNGVSGTSKIDLTINNTEKIFETVSKEINVGF